MKRSAWLCLVAVFGLASVSADELRVWTSRKGSTLEASLVRQDGANATLSTKDRKQVVLKIDDLSLADRQFLVETGGADPKILVTGEVGQPEKQVRIDSAAIKKLKDQKLVFGSETEAEFELTETEHFLIGTAGGVGAKGVAETAERMWHGMAFQHMNFRRDWEDKRMLLLLVEDRAAYAALGRWFQEQLRAMDQGPAAVRVGAMWEESGSTRISLPEEITSRFNLFGSASVYNVKQDDSFKKAMSPFMVHCMANDLLAKQMGGVSSYGSEGYFAFIQGHGFYKEITLTGKCETNLIAATGTDGEGFEKTKGFGEGQSWARELKSFVRKGEIKPEIEPMFKWTADQLKPEQLALIYSFSYYMQSTPQRLTSFAATIRRIESSNQIPAAVELAQLFGFESVEAMEADWTKFIKEGNFK